VILGSRGLIIEVNKFNEDWIKKSCLIEDFEINIIDNIVDYSKSEKNTMKSKHEIRTRD